MSRTITHGGVSLICDDPIEVWRAETMFTKEPGTVKWLDGLQLGDVFYDIGANIGIYTLLAARRVGPSGHVYAFEPHLRNAARLTQNVRESGLDNVTVCPHALHSENGLLPFNYASDRYGSSGSQVGHTTLESGLRFQPTQTITTLAQTLDRIIAEGLRPAQFVKIDVDGNEFQILQGAHDWLSSDVPPRSIQVEVHPRDRKAINSFMDAHGYGLDHVHYTANGQKQMAAGADPASVVNNTVFVKR